MIPSPTNTEILKRSVLPLIPFNRPYSAPKSFEYMREAIAGSHTCGGGPFTKRCNALIEKELGVSKVMLTTSCTDALEMCALLLGLGAGDEFIVPSFTFVSTANAFALHGATPIFCDVRPDTLNLDETLLERLISPKTKAIVLVHYAGVACEMDTILEIAGRHGIPVVEDNAHGIFGKYKGRFLGTFGALSTLSFHETKNFNCGEGGALLVNDPTLVSRAEIILEKGTDRSRFFRGQVDKYTWVDLGSSFLLSDMLAAYLYAQLEISCQIQESRKRIWNHYQNRLKTWALENGVRQPLAPVECEHPHHLFYLLMPSLSERQALIEHLRAKEIICAFHYIPLHLSAKGMDYGGRPGDCPVSEDVSDRLVRLPVYCDLHEPDLDRIISGVLSYRVG